MFRAQCVVEALQELTAQWDKLLQTVPNTQSKGRAEEGLGHRATEVHSGPAPGLSLTITQKYSYRCERGGQLIADGEIRRPLKIWTLLWKQEMARRKARGHCRILNPAFPCGHRAHLVLFQWLESSLCGLVGPSPSSLLSQGQRPFIAPMEIRLLASNISDPCSSAAFSSLPLSSPFPSEATHTTFPAGPSCVARHFPQVSLGTRSWSLSPPFPPCVATLAFLSVC